MQQINYIASTRDIFLGKQSQYLIFFYLSTAFKALDLKSIIHTKPLASSMHMLVVDDELDIEPLFQQRFRKEIRAGEVHLAFAHSGEEALSYLDQHPSKEVLILSDINMPGMSGIELLKQIRTSYGEPSPRVMLITAYSDEQHYRQAMQHGADDFLTKPLDFTALKGKLKNRS